jgi:predicted nucleic acid-binding protein
MDIEAEVLGGKQSKAGAAEIADAIGTWIKKRELKNKKRAKRIASAENIEEADASLIVLAMERNSILLSNDYALISVAEAHGVECWWLSTLILKCVKKKIISKTQAKETLLMLVESGLRLSIEVYAAILNRIEET